MARKSSRRKSSRKSSSKQRVTIWGVLGVVGILVLGYLIQSGFLADRGIVLPPELLASLGLETPDSPPPPPPPPNPDGVVQIYFTTPTLVYPDVPEERVPQPHEQALIADIDAAQTSVHVALFEYNLMSLADALIRAQERGLDVQLALDRENLEDPKDAEWAGLVEEAGIPISWQDSTAFLHSKFFIIDEAIVWTGSWNATTNGTYRNNNNILRLTIPAVTENYLTEFAQMAAGNFGNSKESLTPHFVVPVAETTQLENYFSPRDGVNQRIVPRLEGAQESIKFLTFSYTDDTIGAAMEARGQAGVTVQGVFERRNANGLGSEYERLVNAGLNILEDGNCYTMHHKVIIIDDATVITGSYNFTARAEDTNDENLLIIDDPAIAAQYLAEFERVYGQAQNPTQCGG